jgi:hypothetical protein
MYPFVVYTYYYRNSSAGLRACHLLVHQLNALGVEAYSSQALVNPEWNEPVWQSQSDPFIAVYPEVVHGNPLNAKYVIRWLLNYQGRLGGPKEYPDTDLVFAYFEDIASAAPRCDGLLYLSVVEEDLFFDPGNVHREGTYYWIGKGKAPSKPLGIEITGGWPSTRAELAKLLQSAALLVTYDDRTMLTLEAALCGCLTVLEPGSHLLSRDEGIAVHRRRSSRTSEQLVALVERAELLTGESSTVRASAPAPVQVQVVAPAPASIILLVRAGLGRELVDGPVTGKQYIFYCRNNICASPVDSQDVPRMLQILGACCGNAPKKPKFHIANSSEEIRWYR